MSNSSIKWNYFCFQRIANGLPELELQQGIMVDCRGERALNCRSMDKYLFAERIHEQFVDKVELLLLSTNCEWLA